MLASRISNGMKKISPEKLRALGTLCALAAIALAMTLVFDKPAVPRQAPAQDEPKLWVMELP